MAILCLILQPLQDKLLLLLVNTYVVNLMSFGGLMGQEQLYYWQRFERFKCMFSIEMMANPILRFHRLAIDFLTLYIMALGV